MRAISERGYETHIFTHGEGEGDAVLKQLIRAVAVSGFAAANIMLLSVSVWSGADAATRDLFHWVSAMIAGPMLIYRRPLLLSVRLECAPPRADEHGRADRTCRHSLLCHVAIRDDRPWGACLVRRDRDPSVLPAHRPTLDHMMRGRARSAIRPRTVIAAWRDSPACRRLAGISRRQ